MELSEDHEERLEFMRALRELGASEYQDGDFRVSFASAQDARPVPFTPERTSPEDDRSVLGLPEHPQRPDGWKP